MSLRTFLCVTVLAGLILLSGCETMSPFVRADGTLDCQSLYTRRCSQCHALYDPSDYTDREWAQKVNRYGPRAGVRPDWRPQLIAWLQGANGDD